ncbi:MAG: MoaD/ThiS family protein [bacterium]|nr:MoaD/ThiS family protein [bacterium]
MIVHVPTPLRSYTDERARVEAQGDTLGELLGDLERQFPGMRFRVIDEHDRVRRHIKLFLDDETTEDLGHALGATRDVHIICALSGG